MIHCETDSNDPTKIIIDLQGTSTDIDTEIVYVLFSYICHKTDFSEGKSLMSVITDFNSSRNYEGKFVTFMREVISIIKPYTDDVGVKAVKLALDPSTANSELIKQSEISEDKGLVDMVDQMLNGSEV